jgi:hypothetical protein
MAIAHLFRLHEQLVAQGIAIDGVDADGVVSPASLQSAAQPIIDAFDDSDAAETAYQESLEPLLKDIKDQAQGALDANDTFLALANPNNAAVLAQVRALTQQNNRIIRGLVRTIARTWR